jgi:hypothetical protein
MLLAHRHEERVILAEERRIGGQVRLEEDADRLVRRRRGDQPMPGQHAPRMLVDDEHRTPGGMEQDGVRRLRPDAAHPQQILPEGRKGRPPHSMEAPAEALEQPAGEGAQPAGLQPVPSGRAHGARAVAARERRVEAQQPRLGGVARRPGNAPPADEHRAP